MKKTIILISGKKGTGKSTLAKEIINLFPKNSMRVPFSLTLKNDLRPFIESKGFDWDKDKELYRPLLQGYGQSMRNKESDYWINKTKGLIYETNKDIHTFLIDDCRFKNELNSFDKELYNVIKIKRDRKSIYKGIDNDISETELDDISDSEYDFIISDIHDQNKMQEIYDLLLKYNNHMV